MWLAGQRRWLLMIVLLASATVRTHAQVLNDSEDHSLDLACSAAQAVSYPGDLITITGTVAGYLTEDAKKELVFTWSGPDDNAGSGETLRFKAISPGILRIHGKVSLVGRPSIHGECDVSVIVKALEPPTVSCSASPSYVSSGDPVVVTAAGVSPQGRPLQYAFSASAGTLSSTGPLAQLLTGSNYEGVITVICTIVDDRGQAATATTDVHVSSLQAAASPPSSLPAFPWPPPTASDRKEVPIALGRSDLKTMGDIDRLLIQALSKQGYVQKAHYAVPGGYVLVTRVEQIDIQGMSARPPYRFANELPPPQGLSDYMQGLFGSRPGYFRMIAFVVTYVDFNDSGSPLTLAEANTLLDGPPVLPDRLGKMSLPPSVKVTALIYEYQKLMVGRTVPAVLIGATVPAQTHLERAGLWQLLVSP